MEPVTLDGVEIDPSELAEVEDVVIIEVSEGQYQVRIVHEP